mgnify:CR=1 FL=1
MSTKLLIGIAILLLLFLSIPKAILVLLGLVAGLLLSTAGKRLWNFLHIQQR